MRRTKATVVRARKNIRAIHLLPGHTRIESSLRYVVIKIEVDALDLEEQTVV